MPAASTIADPTMAGLPSRPAPVSPDIWPLRIVAALMGPLVYYAPLGTPILLGLMALAAGWPAWRRGQLRLPRDLAGILIFCPLLAWMFLSALWSLDAKASLALAGRITAIFVGGTLLGAWLKKLAREEALAMLVALAWGFIAASAVVIIDTAANGPLLALLHPGGEGLATLYSRGADVQALIAVPLFLVLRRAGLKRLGVAQLALAVIALMINTREEPALAIILSLLAVTLVMRVPYIRWILPIGLAVAAIGTPLLLPINLTQAGTCSISWLRHSVTSRLIIWNFADEHIRERPFVGWGLDASRRMPHGVDEYAIYDCDDDWLTVDRYLPLHTHNMVLQVWLELGAIGAFLGIGALVYLMYRVFAAPVSAMDGNRAVGVLVGMIVPALSVGFVSFGIWQEWWLSAVALTIQVTVPATKLN